MELTYCGAAGVVTGSCHHLRIGRQQLLLDCGLFQGGREEEARNIQPFPFDPRAIDAVVLSHAHLDHCGRLPLLVRRGFDGPIYSHPASIDLVRVLLKDAAYLEQADVERENRKRARRGEKQLKPLFDLADVEAVMARMRPLQFNAADEVLPGVAATLLPAGHILGAASVVLDVHDAGRRKRVVFSGDLGPSDTTLLRNPAPPDSADLVLLESTYGDRNHRSRSETLQEIGSVLEAAWEAGGNLLVPAFAIGRTQEVLALFASHRHEWNLDRWRIFVDSPMAIQATGIHLRHADLFNDEAQAFMAGRSLRELLPNLHETPEAAQSMQLNNIRRGAIILAGAGMCTGGRILHHLRHNLWRSQTQVMIIGYQSEGTLGRRLVDRAEVVRIYGEDVRVQAGIHTVGGLSAHAGQDELVKWYGSIGGRPPVHLVHGEKRGRDGLAARLNHDYGVIARMPGHGEVITL
ncbi:MBL fold metallo-hydrolase RNA specificity domain-containing protein [Pseudofulvimonas gallinarii]|uniref:Metallo-beta-lactamase family protein n=2 Tax=Pseudofulvimonas gallinarii TaxID=634155 RepID=A0A4R3LCN0_9GAMM|nr:MBL fold metallo-hydrolase [Pseudofulvimonas gallinarii]TCS97723.1 metallo-beta-lactamase family protein [Pseudofulvimonas gallinarii]THD13357.1 MBL fold metallo-hydrolase [Pseudofulvimonas gallinarii]